MISLATPVVTAIVAAVFGLKIAALAWVGICLAVGGDAFMTVSGLNVAVNDGQGAELYYLGICLSVAAMLARGCKTALQDKLMNDYGTAGEGQKLSPLALWYFQGPLLISFGIPAALLFEGFSPITNLPSILANPFLLLANIAGAMGVNIMGMCVIKMLGAPASQIAGKFNVLVVAALSCALLGEILTLSQGLAALLILGGAAIFEKSQEKKIQDFQGLLNAFQGEKYSATV